MNLPYAKKELGQHWLTDKSSLEAIADAASLEGQDTVLEIGPGTGTLTDILIEKAGQIFALEYDRQRAEDLAKKYGNTPNLEVKEGDIRSFDLSSLPRGYKIVANIPYYLTANLLRKLVDAENKPHTASLLVQKEVAERVCAKPGNLSQVAVFVQIFYKPSSGEHVPAYLFTPSPKVDSQVLILELRDNPLVPVDDTFIRVIKAGFSEKRKKLRSSLSGGLQMQKPDIEIALSRAGLSPDSRAQELSVEQWYHLKAVLYSSNT